MSTFLSLARSALGTVWSGLLSGVLAVGGAAGCSSPGTVGTGISSVPVPPAVDLHAPDPAAMVTPVNLSLDLSSIRFDDFAYSPTLHKLLVPGASTHRLFLVDPDSLVVSTIAGFSPPPPPPADGGTTVLPKSGGITSICEGQGLLYTSSQTDQKLYVVDPGTKSIVGTVALTAKPDVVRYVATTSEVWITQPDTAHAIEILSLKPDPRMPVHAAAITIPAGPQGLAVSSVLKAAFTSTMRSSPPSASNLVIDLQKRSMSDTWSSGCADPQNPLVDEADGLLFVACGEGGVVAVDAKSGTLVSALRTAGQIDSLGFSAKLRHLYVPGPTLLIVGVSKSGMLSALAEIPTPGQATTHAVADDRGHVFVLEPATGQLLRITDNYPASS